MKVKVVADPTMFTLVEWLFDVGNTCCLHPLVHVVIESLFVWQMGDLLFNGIDFFSKLLLEFIF